MNKNGRPTKLTPSVQAAIVQAVSLGVPIKTAGSYVGVSEKSLTEWLARGQGRHSVRGSTKAYAAFAEAVEQARAQDEVRRIARLEQAARGGQVIFRKVQESVNAAGEVVKRVIEERHTEPQWTADAWFLERSYPDRWGRRERLDLHVAIEAAAAKVASDLGLTADEVLLEARQLLQEMDHAE